ncbi:MAG TPA: gamma-glutamyltransferase [Caulobacteraceae bacterium]|nr:gamma-glutamyltransferase [Caulobacteraceae bacterium]
MRRIAFSLAALFALAAAPAAPAAPAIAPAALQGGPVVSRSALAAARPVLARHAMVVTAQHLATEVGVDILRRGGNAVDAAVAVGYALAVVEPCCGNIGGGGFMTLHLADGRNLFLDFRETAPEKATPTLFQDAKGKVVPGLSTRSWLAIGVPGTVMGLDAALARYGTMSLRQVMAPAIALAAKGFVLRTADTQLLDARARLFAAEPNVAAIFLDHGAPWRPGERLVQSDLARTLEEIAAGGTRAFYDGPAARAVVAAAQKHGGILALKDFADYRVNWEPPVACAYHGYTIVSAPPPSSGGATICETLQILAPYPLQRWGFASVKTTHYLVEAERRAFMDRNADLGDPAFVHDPLGLLISPAYAAKLRASIAADRATPTASLEPAPPPPEGADTTHYSVVDARGDAVSVTYTINLLFGAGRIAGDTGFFLNDEMDDFTSKPGTPNAFGLVQGVANQVEGGKRPLSSMAPTLVLKGARLFLVTGSPGGSTIISTTLENILDVVDFGMNVQQAVDAPRIHEQGLPDIVLVEPGYLTPASRRALAPMGYDFRTLPGWGADEAIEIDPRTGEREGANDPRRPDGLAAGF